MADKSLFIVIEGLDGSGKTSVSRYLTKLLESILGEKVKLTFEPHDPSCAGLFIRQVLMKKIRGFSPRVLPLAFASNRLDHCDREINPWLEASNDNIIICDRYYLSSIVYQTTSDFSSEAVLQLNEKATKPDLIFFLDVSNKVCYERMKKRGEPKELFESSLSKTRGKYKKAIEFLRDTNDEKIIEIDASGSIESVATHMLENIFELRPDLKTKNFNNSEAKYSLERLAGEGVLYSSFDDNDNIDIDYSIDECIKDLELGIVYNDDLGENTSVEFIESKIHQLGSLKLGNLFLDYIKKSGVQVLNRLPWTEMDAYELEFSMPGNILLRGVALVIQESQRYDVIMKRAPDIPSMSDFMYVFSPGASELVTSYYERDKIKYNTDHKDEGLFPATQLITQKDIAVKILEELKNPKTYKEAFRD